MKYTLKAAINEVGRVQAESAEPAFLNSTSPASLFHYTDSYGLYGILKDARLWASDFNFLNDRSELLYGVQFLQSHFKGRTDAFSTELSAHINAFKSEGQLYVVSFCERDDLLSQWRGYSKNSDGYSLAFRYEALKGLIAKRKVILRKLIYDPVEQTKLIERLLEQLIEIACNVVDLESSQKQAFNLQLAGNLISSAIQLKDPSFAGEQEWRLIAGRVSGFPELFRVANGHFVPYVEIPFDRADLTKITQGPGRYRDANVEALQRLLTANKFTETCVCKSSVPL